LQIAVVEQPGGAQEHIESDEDAKPCIPCSRLFAHGLPLIPSVAIDLATAAAAILAIVPASSIARPQCMETAVQGALPRSDHVQRWPEFGIAVSFWRGCPRSDAI
jgi:hypothetical protein